MIKFISSDLDGTILKNGAQTVDESLFEVINRLVDNGIYFAPASGRQITSIKRLFAPIADRLMYIAENGALVEYKGDIIAKTPMERQLAIDIINDLVQIPNCEALVSGVHTSYIKPKSKEFEHRMTKVVNYRTTIVERFEDIPEDILKVSVCDMSGIANSQDYLIGKWGQKASAAVSGSLFLDFTDKFVSKGKAVEEIQKYFGIDSGSCMAFGDNYNDITMLDQVGEAYVMDTAADDIKVHGNHIISSVEDILKQKFLL